MLVQSSWKHHRANVCFSIKQLHDLRMWLACLFGEALACLVRLDMQKGALLCTPCVCEQYQISVLHLKISSETNLNQVFHLGLPSGEVPWVLEVLWAYRRCSGIAVAGEQ